MFLYYKNKARGDIFEEKGISDQSNSDPAEANAINQSNTKSP